MLAGCSATLASDEADADATTVTALVVVEHSSPTATRAGHGEAHARFVRARAGDDGALDLVAGAEAFPAVGACSGPSSPLGASRPIELLDVGTVTVEADGVRTNLVARRLPDVVSLVSGVLYIARGPEDGAFGPAHYTVRVAGSAALRGTDSATVPAFEREADAPPTLAAVRVDGQDGAGTVLVDATADVTWEPAAAATNQTAADDVIVIDRTEPSGAATRCTYADTGRARVTDLQGAGVLTLHRVRRVAFVAAGVDRGELRFDFSRALAYRRR